MALTTENRGGTRDSSYKHNHGYSEELKRLDEAITEIARYVSALDPETLTETEETLTETEKNSILLDYAFQEQREATGRKRLSPELKEDAVPSIIKKKYRDDWYTLEGVLTKVRKRKPRLYAEELRRLSENGDK